MNNLGLAQTGGTCWLHSPLNLFLMSEDGFKILWAKMQDVYKAMTPTYRAWFNANINAPCPSRLKSLTTINAVYFWKFLDQFMCSIGGPGRLWRKHGRNANLVSRVKWNNPALRNAPLNAGSYPRNEIPKLLRHLGFKQGEYGLPEWRIWRYKGAPANRNYKFFMYRRVQPYDLLLTKGPYRLTGACFVMYNRARTGGHVWTCIRKGDKGYIFDSSKPNSLHACNWWNQAEVEDFFANSNLIRSWGPNYHGVGGGYFDAVMYSRSSYVDSIAPSCRRVYRPLHNSTKANINSLRNNDPNVGQNVNQLNVPPAIKAELRKYEAGRVNITAPTLNALVREAPNYNFALEAVSNLERSGYRVPNKNKPNSNWAKFRTALRNKFARPLPANYYRWAVYSNTRNAAMKNVQNAANLGGYVIPKNSNNYKNFIRKLNLKFPNRVLRSAKRKRQNV